MSYGSLLFVFKTYLVYMGFEAFTAVVFQVEVFWFVTPRSVVVESCVVYNS